VIWNDLFEYQRQSVTPAVERPGLAIFCEQGTGKTWIAAGIIERLISPTLTALVVVPLANIETTWDKLLRDKLTDVRLCRDLATFRRMKSPKVLLVHYEAVHADIKKLQKTHWTVVIYDESQRLKGRGTKQSRDAAKFKQVDHRVILSGTPIEQAPQDLWAQFRFALPDVLGTRWIDFENQWLRRTGYMGYKREFKWPKLNQFLELIHPHIIRVKKDEVLDLPPVTFKMAPVTLLGQQARIYQDLVDDYATTVDGKVVIADMAITQLIRLQQVCGGFIRTDPDDSRQGTIVIIGEAKLRKLRVIVEREDKPIVIFCKYLQELQIIVDDLTGKYRIGVIQGSNRKHRPQVIRDFQDGKLDILVCQIKTGGVGIDLYRAHVAIFYSQTYSSIDFDQASCRIHRHGQTEPVRIYLIFARNTVDETIHRSILSKQLVIRKVLPKRGQVMAKLEKTKKEEKVKVEKKAKVEKNAAEATEAAGEEKKEETAAEPQHKYTVTDLAKDLNIKAASVRVKLRNAEIEKAGKSYGWDTDEDYTAVLKKLKSKPEAVAEATEEKAS